MSIGPNSLPQVDSGAEITVEQNLAELAQTFVQMKQPWVEAIAKGDGFEPYHSAEIAKLTEMEHRVGYLVRTFSVTDPLSERAVREMIARLDELDAARNLGQITCEPSWQQWEQLVDQSIAAAARPSDESPLAA